MDEATRKRVHAGRLMWAGKTPAEAAKAVGLAQAACLDELLPQYPGRAQTHRTAQAQDRPDAQIDHRRMLEAGRIVVMSWVM